MALRVAVYLVAASLALAEAAPAGYPAGSAEAAALLGRWHEALARPGGRDTTDPGSRYVRAVSLWELGIHGKAERLLRVLSDAGGPRSGAALEFAVSRLFEAGRYPELIEWVVTSRASVFEDADGLHYRVGQSLFLTGRDDEARAHLAQVTSGPSLPYARHSLALIAFAGGRVREAEQNLRAALAAVAAVPVPATRHQLADSLRLTLARVLYHAGTTAPSSGDAAAGRLALAREEFGRIGAQSLFRPDALRGLGWAELERGRWVEALAAFETAGALDPGGLHEDLWARGRVHLRLQQYAQAAELFAAARVAAERAAANANLTGPSPAVFAWTARSEELGRTRARATDLEGDVRTVAAALQARAARLEAYRGILGRHRARLETLGEDLKTLDGTLSEHLGEAPGASFFRGEERNRVEALSMRRDLLVVHIARLETAIAAVELGRRARGEAGPPRSRVELLWSRLRQVRQGLAEARQEFLETLGRRRAEREARLARGIRDLIRRVASARRLAAQAAEALTGAEQRDGGRLALLSTLAARREILAEALTGFEDWTREQVRSARQEEARQRAEGLRRRSDRYALDEVQALDLAREAHGPEAGGLP